MSGPDLAHVRKLLVEANEELRIAAELNALIDQHSDNAKKKLADAKAELLEVAKLVQVIAEAPSNGTKGQMK